MENRACSTELGQFTRTYPRYISLIIYIIYNSIIYKISFGKHDYIVYNVYNHV